MSEPSQAHLLCLLSDDEREKDAISRSLQAAEGYEQLDALRAVLWRLVATQERQNAILGDICTALEHRR